MTSGAILLEAREVRAPIRVRLGARKIDGLLMLLAALALRWWWFGNPVVQVDEQFYLLFGDRMLHGSVPFINIWDRKPIGLFLVYAAIRLLGGSGFVQYQMVATGCAAMAAFLIVRMARLYASGTAARLAGLASLLWLIVFDGAGGQAPIFYNPLVAGAALLTLTAFRSPDRRRIGWAGTGAMLLIGLAIQIKYTALFEGVGLGIVLLCSGWRERIRLPRLAALALLWVGLAVAPTLLALALYAHWGATDAFFYANFLSIGQRSPTAPAVLARRLGGMLLMAAPLIAAAGVAMRSRFEGDAARVRRFVLIWLAAAAVGLLSIGTFYTHYFLPVIVPLSIAAAPAFDRLVRWHGVTWRPALLVLVVGAVTAAGVSLVRLHKRGDGHEVAAVASAIRPRLNGCLFVFDGEPALYQMTHACLATRFAFPGHLAKRIEANAIGTDPVREVERVMDARPAMIVISDRPAKAANRATWAVMTARLRHGYALVAAVPINHRLRLVYQRTV